LIHEHFVQLTTVHPDDPKIVQFSIITPSFRNSDWLKLCIASVADQGVELEHIVQDAKSDDGTLDWLPSDPRVKAFVEKDRGMYDAVNRGLIRATGDILGYLNCDEQLLPGALKAVSEYFHGHPEVEIVFADTVLVGPAGEFLCFRKVQAPLLPYILASGILPTLTCSTFFRRSVIERHQLLFDDRLRALGDAQWMVRALKKAIPMSCLRRYTSVFTQTGDNMMLQESAQRERWDFMNGAPALLRIMRPLLILHHRCRKALGGCYHQSPFSYSIYTLSSPRTRITFSADKPGFRWRYE
jgi:glycosyltransferase involved in cell wall biosynthesis